MRSFPTLSKLAQDIEHGVVRGNGDPVISSIEYDSRSVANGSLFVALRGRNADGTAFIADAVQRGASAIAGESPGGEFTIPTLIVPDARKALAELAWAFHGHPERALVLTAVTGTNGKTTVATLLREVLERTQIPCGLVGTLGVFTGSDAIETARTTPEAPDLAGYFSAMIERGTAHAVMEATSIGIDLERTWRLPFRVAIFTNLSRDHLDYHEDWASYRAAKLRLFSEQASDGVAILNADDAEAAHFLKAAHGRAVTYSLTHEADYRAVEVELDRRGLSFTLVYSAGQVRIRSALIGRFNVSNLLAVIAAADALGITMKQIVSALAVASPVRGRAEMVASSAPFTVVVDYAHTPDALEKILTTLRDVEHGRLLTVIGAGGNRDRGKRPLMAAVAHRFSDRLFLTSDNPRNENPDAILDDVQSGLPSGSESYRNADRRSTIEEALAQAQPGDIVLIAGKGHETYQEIRGVRHPFDDRAVVENWLHRAGFRA
ncbi:MAG: UDP-N-acetylmuramoyl-L-alanyl-D-glutamate--2,6-diaminopimelate ligase [bacterium]|nr:UDP-N-acetylmuramoyl-L-alanyl-D-glutamate--2,6-diaminopimelate ligase [bacterium]